MNIAFFLTPKLEVIYESVEGSMGQALKSMEKHGYSAIPLIDKAGRYVGTLTEGDLLWKLKNKRHRIYFILCIVMSHSRCFSICIYLLFAVIIEKI